MLPVYVVTGFLESGKTTFLNGFMNHTNMINKTILIIQFEKGEEYISSELKNCSVLYFPIKLLEQDSSKIGNEIYHYIMQKPCDEIWIEWNGMVPFSKLQSLLLGPSLGKTCKIDKVIHITNMDTIKNLLGNTGNALPEQISNSDYAILQKGTTKKEYRQTGQLLRNINPGIKLLNTNSMAKLYEKLYIIKNSPLEILLMQILAFILLYLMVTPVLERLNIPINKIIVIFIGILLQAFPFLLIGVLLSSAIQVFISKDFIERKFPKSLGMGMLAALFLGFCLPVCDCASIPIFRSLIKKGISIPVAVTFMIVTPVINPVVMLSTFYAFGGSWEVVATRVLLGIISALCIGILLGYWCSKEKIFTGGFDKLMCSCGCYESNEAGTTAKEKISLFIRHSQAEFFQVGKYLIIGTLISAVLQTIGMDRFVTQNGTGYTFTIVMMMLLAFALSLCSSSDAVIARSFASQIPFGAIMGFLVFGPMIDIKNVLMLSSGISKKFIAKLAFTAFIVCFLVIIVYSHFVLGGV